MWMGKGMAQFSLPGRLSGRWRTSSGFPPATTNEIRPGLLPFQRPPDGVSLGGRFRRHCGDNLDLFEQAGLPPPGPEWTLEDFRQAARRLTVREDGQVRQWGLLR